MLSKELAPLVCTRKRSPVTLFYQKTLDFFRRMLYYNRQILLYIGELKTMPAIQENNFSTKRQVRATFKNNDYKMAVHIHQFAEIVYILEGETEVRQKGSREIARPGDIVVLYPYQPHGFYTENDKRVKFWMLLFADSFITDIIRQENAYLGYENTVFTPSAELKAYVESKMFDTQEQLVELNAAQSLNLKALLYPVFSEFLKQKQRPIRLSTALKEKSISSDPVTRTVNYLRVNFCRDVLIIDCAKEIGYSNSYISHCLSKFVGMTFIELRDALRVSYAKNLLTHDTMSVYRIGVECGFNCERSFERVFKKATDLTPRQYKKKNSKSAL